MTEWNISSRGHACAACGTSFGDQEIYHTLLFDERSELRRMDVCDKCWQAQYSDGGRDRKGFVSYWHGVYEAPPPPAKEAIQKENAESLLRKLIELGDERYSPAAYILAVMLERKRLLKVKEQLFRDNHRVFIYEQPKTGDVFTIVDPNLQLDQLEAIQRDVGDLLEHGLPNPEGAGAQQGSAVPPMDPTGDNDNKDAAVDASTAQPGSNALPEAESIPAKAQSEP